MTPPPVTDEMIDQLAKALWQARDGRSWDEAGDYWQPIWREIAALAWQETRRIDGEQEPPAL